MKHREFHFFASSVGEWATTTDHRTLRDLIDLMEHSRFEYSLWKVPGPWDDNYTIEHYAPQVGGAVYLGKFNPQ